MALPTMRVRRLRRSDRVFWSISLASLAVAGLYSSARAADERSAWDASTSTGCDASQVAWGYDVELVPGAGYAIAGMHFDTVPSQCAGTPIVVVYTGVDRVPHSAALTLVAGAVDRLDPAVLADIASPDMTATWSLAG